MYDVQSGNAPAYDARQYADYGGYVPSGPVSAPPPTGGQYADPREVEQAVALRNAALMRLREMSSRHGMHAYDQRNRADALGPHAVAFLYHDIERRPGTTTQNVIRAATRLFRDDPEIRDLPQLLHTLAGIAGQYADRGRFDVRTVMAHRSDDMSVMARYAGLAVSTLDTLAGQWVDIGQHITSALQVAGRSYILLLDGTQMVLDRGGSFGVVGTTYSSHPLEVGQQVAYGTWKRLQRAPDDPTEAIWAGLNMLHQQVCRAVGPEADAIRTPRRHR